jgi:hypothetical protein
MTHKAANAENRRLGSKSRRDGLAGFTVAPK